MLGRCSFLLKAFAILVLCQSFGMADIMNNRNIAYSGRYASRNDYREPNFATTRIMRTRELDRKYSYRRATLDWLNVQERRLEIIPRRETLKLNMQNNRRDMRTVRADRRALRYADKAYSSIRDQRDRRNFYEQVPNRQSSRLLETMRTDAKRSSVRSNRIENLTRNIRAQERKALNNREENLRKFDRKAGISNRSSRFMLERVPIESRRTVRKQDNIRERTQTMIRQKRQIVSNEDRRNREVTNFENRRLQNMLITPVGDTIQKRVFKGFRTDMSRNNFSQQEGQQFNYLQKTQEGQSVLNFVTYKFFASALQGLLVVSMFKSSNQKMNCVLSLFSKSGIKI